jgi:hypothetical protein
VADPESKMMKITYFGITVRTPATASIPSLLLTDPPFLCAIPAAIPREFPEFWREKHVETSSSNKSLFTIEDYAMQRALLEGVLGIVH